MSNFFADARSAGVRFYQFHDLAGRLVATVAARRVGPDTMRFAGTVVSDKDLGMVWAKTGLPVVTKEIGATIAYGRLLKGDGFLLPVEEFFEQVAEATILLWLGEKHAVSQMTRGHLVWSRGIARRRKHLRNAALKIEERAPQEVSHE